MNGPLTALVRPALQLACAVAKEGERSRPPVEVPGPMRPLLRFSRLGDRALEAVRHVVDEDQEFRARVAAAADEHVLGRVSWLWLARPEGWEDELATAAAESEERLQLEGDRRAERDARRRLGLVEAALARAEAELAESRVASAALTAELADLRQERRTESVAAARDRAALAAEIEARSHAEREAVDAGRRRSELEQRLTDTARCLADSEAANRQLSAQLTATKRQLVAGEAALRVEEDRSAASAAALGHAVSEAAASASRLGLALANAARILDGGPVVPLGPPLAEMDGRPARVDGDMEKGERGAGSGVGPRRLPVRLPRAVFDDSPEASAWLVRLPGVVLIVDGYNVTLATWPARGLPDQRHRLVTALAELSMRTGAEVEVVFDGADDHAHPLRSMGARRPVRIMFSPPAVEADEVIIERVAQLPATRPVIVATDDRRVREACSSAGANLLSTQQLVTVLGRNGPIGA